jgi:hypothetical protein
LGRHSSVFFHFVSKKEKRFITLTIGQEGSGRKAGEIQSEGKNGVDEK